MADWRVCSLAALLGLAACGPPVVTGHVVRIVDGDTFYLDGLAESVRVWGLDAPEMDEEGGFRAKSYISTLIDSNALTCHLRGRDRYFRNVALCTLPDGRDIAAEMIRAGVAVEYRKYSHGYYADVRPVHRERERDRLAPR